MTNGEKILSLFPDMVTDCREMYVFAWIEQESAHFSKEWWNAEYKEPCYSEKPNKSEILTGSTTKNNLAVDCINKAEFVEKLESETIGLQSWQKSLIYQVMDDCYSLTPQEPILDKLRERVELEKLGYPPSAGYYRAIMKVLEIIDEYKAGSEDKE